jgi:hypothetical protein
MKKFYLYIPVIVFTLLFAADKIMLLPQMQRLSQTDPTYLFYNYKSELLDQMEAAYKKNQEIKAGYDAANHSGAAPKKFMVVLGSSRLLYFDYQTFKRSYPDWELFNFSAPVTAPAYYAFIMERILERGIIPDYVVLEADPFQYNESSDAFMKSNVGFSFDFRFVFSHFNDFTREESGYFIARNIFASYKYHPSIDHIMNRLKDPSDARLATFDMSDKHQRENRGCGRSLIPREDWYERDYARLAVTSQTTKRWLYGNYKLSGRQFRFFDETLGILSEKNIHTLIVRPQVSRPMERLLDEDENLKTSFAKWRNEINAMKDKYNYKYIDLSETESYSCNTFVDGSHMSLDCYTPFMTLLMRDYWEKG